MGKFDVWIAIGAIGAVAVGYLYFTKGGGFDLGGIGRGISGIEATLGGYDDPYKYYNKDTADAWVPGSKMYREIQKRISEDNDDRKNKKNKEVQKHLIESYFVEDYKW